MKREFLTFRRFNELAMAKELTSLLDEKNIEYETEENSLVANPLLVSGDEMTAEFCIKLRKDDFNKVNALLVANAEQATEDIESDYYLFDFTNEELKDILINFDDWSAFDFALARKILKERGIFIDEKEIVSITTERIIALEKPEKSEKLWVVIGYMSALIGGVIGIFIGWMMWRFKKTLPNGEQVYAYVDDDRKHGKRIFIIGIVVFIFLIIQRFHNSDYY